MVLQPAACIQIDSMDLSHIQTEIDAWFLYSKLAEKEEDPIVADIFRQMSEIEFSHAQAFAQKMKVSIDLVSKPSWRAKTILRIGKLFGYEYILGTLLDTEKGLANTVMKQKKSMQMPLTGAEDAHVQILRNILDNDQKVSASQLSRFEKRHRSVGGNAIRAAVLGGNDGLVSNFSLVMGVAGASANQAGVMLAGSAGLLAGALSMALGEWISVKSSQELYENQMQLEMEELETNPEGERKELKLIYMAKGIPEDQAEKIVDELLKDTKAAHEVLVKEELGINAEELKGSAMEAALSSFFLFAIGAIIPLIPFMFTSGMKAIVLSTVFSAFGLFLIGAAITLFTGRNVWFSGFRQVFFGLCAAAVTYGIGMLIGVSIGG
jgi:VIT1/CCC1 family predicted Fe2+/Mn2+ transporter